MAVGNTVILRILLFIVGTIFLVGGVVFVKQAFDGAKNMIQSVLFSLMGVMTGLLLLYWAIGGIPD